MKRECDNGKWWDVIAATGGKFCVAVGKDKECFVVECFKTRQEAYKQKNKWLTKFNMFCC